MQCYYSLIHNQPQNCQEYGAIPDSEGVENITSIAQQSDKTYKFRGGCINVSANGSYQFSYGPGGMLGLKRNFYALLCAFFVSIGGLEFGYDQGVVSLSYDPVKFLLIQG